MSKKSGGDDDTGSIPPIMSTGGEVDGQCMSSTQFP